MEELSFSAVEYIFREMHMGFSENRVPFQCMVTIKTVETLQVALRCIQTNIAMEYHHCQWEKQLNFYGHVQ